MWNIFKSKERKRKEAIMANIHAFAILEQYASKGLLIVDDDKKMVCISSIIIRPYQTDDKLMKNFLNAVANWVSYYRSQLVWETEWFKAEHAAVLEAKKTNPHLTDTEIAAIRQKARENVEYDEEKFKQLGDYTYMVFNDAVLTKDSELISVGEL